MRVDYNESEHLKHFSFTKVNSTVITLECAENIKFFSLLSNFADLNQSSVKHPLIYNAQHLS